MCLPLSPRTDQSLGGERGLCLAQGSPPTGQPSQWHHSVSALFLDVEWMPIHTRACVGTLTGYVYSLGQFLLAGMALAMPHWRHLQLAVSVPFFAFFIYSWYVAPGGQGCPRAAQRAARDKTSPRSHCTLHCTDSEKVKARGQTQASASTGQMGELREEGFAPQGSSSSAPPDSPACLCHCLYPTPQS